ncbi:MAG: endo-1,4-beta-xylanase [Oscillospiraceae bacterium]|nr:endo-1,4-beta-xylanase [Oscillospiraceae bacterium]
MKRKFFGLLSAAVLTLTSIPATVVNAASVGDVLRVGNGQTQHKGNCDGFSYELWLDTTGGSGSMTLGKGATFKAEWSASVNRGNYLARRGLDFGAKQKATSYDYIGMDYEATYKQTGSANGNSRLCVYGWFQNKGVGGNVPLVEYYIIEDWVDWVPDASGKMVTIDGAQYKIFQMDHTGPSINSGSETFKQYFSVRQQKRTSGHITVSDHFKAWADQGWGIGNLYEVALNAEGWQSSGVADVTKLDVYTDPSGKVTGVTPGTTTTFKPVDPDANGYYFNEGFENGKGDFTGRAGASVAANSSCYAEGSGSLKVTNRSQDYSGAMVSLDPAAFKAGETYSFNTAVMQNEGSSTNFKLTLQYDDASGTESYDEIATTTGSSGVWTTLGNTSYKIPAGATNMKLYVETPDSTVDFYVDSISGAVSGTKSKIDLSNAKPGNGGTTTTVTTAPIVTTPVQGGDSSSHQNNNYTYDKNGQGFKDAMGPYFRLGTAVNAYNIRNAQVANFIKQNFNSITCENEMKPDSICDQQKSSGDNIAINLNQAAPILQFCEQNGIGLRGHTFVWYSQTPEWIFKENMQSNSGSFVSPDRMNKRLESMIKNTFEAIKTQYPNLKIYSYDVCNELFKNDGGGFRGDGGEYSNWWKCYGNDSFVINAFKYARQYAPKDCKLYMNDYNEYFGIKCDDLYNMAKKIMAEGDYIDGIGMQSHLHAADFGKTGSAHKSTDNQMMAYADAIDKFASLGLDVQITELDVTAADTSTGSNLYVDVFRAAMERSGKISSLTLWGHCDSASWRQQYEDGGNPLPFDSNCQPKAFYSDIINLTKEVSITQGTTTTTTAKTTTTTVTTTTTTTTTTKNDTSNVKLGDVNCDKTVDVADAVLLARLLAEDNSAKVSTQGQLNADCNKSGKPDTDDVTLILKAVAFLIEL